MPIKGHQQFALAGARMYFREDSDDPAIVNPLVDLGIVEMEPALEQTKIELQDGSSGVNQLAASVVSETSEDYNLTCRNLAAYNFGILVGASLEELTQTAGELADIKHYAWPDQPFGLLDADYDDGGVRISAINTTPALVAKLDSSGTPGTTIDAADVTVDYEKGLCTISSDGLAAAGVVWLTFTKLALTGYRRLRPQTREFSRTGHFEMYIGIDGNQTIIKREFDGSISGTGLGLSTTEFSNIQFQVSVTSDPTDTQMPAGTFDWIKGTLPTVMGPVS